MMTPILLHACPGTESAWISVGNFTQIQFTPGRFRITERTKDGRVLKTEAAVDIITLSPLAEWVKVKYLEGDQQADVDLIYGTD